MNKETYTTLINETARQLVIPNTQKKRQELLKRLWDSIELLFPEEVMNEERLKELGMLLRI